MPSTRPPSVIIVGAGFAGLAAAYDLHTRGLHVRVVDARARIGGRVHTIREGFADDQHGEAGGELIESDHTALIELAQSLGLRLTRILRKGFGSHLLGPDGRVRHHASQTTDWKKLTAAFSSALDIYRRAGDRYGWDSAVARVLGVRSAEQHLEALKTRDKASAKEVAWLCTQVTALHGFFLADGRDLSMLMLLDELMSDEDPGARRAFRIVGGNDRLATALAKKLGKDAIQLRREVVAIAQTDNGVRVSMRDARDVPGDAGGDNGGDNGADPNGVLEADYVIVTAPATAVRRMRFDPALPPEQHRAIETLPYGQATKTLLQCSRPFWRTTDRPRAYGTNLDVGAVWDGSEGQPGRAAILVSLAGGSSSAEAQELLRTEGPEAFIERVVWMRGAQRTTPTKHSKHSKHSQHSKPPKHTTVIASHSTTWEHDRWAGGGYAYFSPSFDPSLRRWLAAPAGRILFAGEHTSREWQGYMNGALTSGRRAAMEVLALAGRV